MELSSIFEANETDKIYSVCLAEGFFVDVKVLPKTGLSFIMENGDGSTVYGDSGTDETFPDYSYDKKDVISFVKSLHQKAEALGMPLSYDESFLNNVEKREDLRGRIDILSPQESADLFGRSVRCGEHLYLPKDLSGREGHQAVRKPSLQEQVNSAKQKLPASDGISPAGEKCR